MKSAPRVWARIPAWGLGLLIGLLLFSAPLFYGYSVLTHEAIVDSAWDTSTRQMLVKRFPMATPEQLEQAHAYAYGGCIVQTFPASLAP